MQLKLTIMRMSSLLLLLWLETLVMMILVEPIVSMIGFPYDAVYLSLMIAALGVGLGFALLGIKRLPFRVQRYLKIGFFTFYPLLLLIVYLAFDLNTFFSLVVFLIKLLFIVLLCAIPLLITYGIVKRNAMMVIAPSFGMMLLFFLTRAITGTFIIQPADMVFFVGFFLAYLLFFELALGSIYFSSMVERLTIPKQDNVFLLQRFTMVFHSYLLYLCITLGLCFCFTGGVVLLKNMFLTTNSTVVFGIPLRSLTGFYLFVLLVIIGVLLFWLLTPMKKNTLGRLLGVNRTQPK